MANDLLNGLDDDDHDEPSLEVYRLGLDGDWGLWEFSGFGRQYVQSYAVYHLLISAESGDRFSLHRLQGSVNAFPWRGGWSSVDFFESVMNAIPRKQLPRIRRIQYSSPGFVELTVGLVVAAHLVGRACDIYDRIRESYTKTIKSLKENKLMNLDIKAKELDVRERELSLRLLEDHINAMEMHRFDRLLRSNDVNPLASLKMVLALSRRIKPISKLRREKKLRNDDDVRL